MTGNGVMEFECVRKHTCKLKSCSLCASYDKCKHCVHKRRCSLVNKGDKDYPKCHTVLW